ncbi:MAG: acyltransferase [Clostridia bacterium]|nr:acyltransferase [Clostridia bacterium]
MDEVRLVNARRSFDSIDIAKFLGSILIFAMHGSALDDFKIAPSVLEIAARWGVPFFFISSAYFLFRKSENGNIERAHLRHYLFRIGMLYLCWMVFNLPSVYLRRLYQKDLTAVSTWLTFIKNSVLSSTFTGSWYLVSCMFSACLVYWLSKRFHTKTIMLFTLPLYLLCALTSMYKGILPKQAAGILGFLCFPLNLFSGCFYFALGKYISENESRLEKKLTKSKILILFFAFYAVYTAEFLVTKHYDIFTSSDAAFSSAAAASALFLFCLRLKIKIKNDVLLRKLSIIIYCCQSNVLFFNSLCVMLLGVHYLTAFLMSCLVVAAVSIVIFAAQKKTRWKWVNYMT